MEKRNTPWLPALQINELDLATYMLESVLRENETDMVSGRALCHLALLTGGDEQLITFLRALYAGQNYSPYYNYLVAYWRFIQGDQVHARNQLRWAIRNAFIHRVDHRFAQHLLAALGVESFVDDGRSFAAARLLLEEAVAKEAAGDVQGALESAVAATRTRPDLGDIVGRLAAIARRTGQVAAARDALLEIQDARVYSAALLYALATLHADLGEWARTRDAAKGALMLDPTLADAQSLYNTAQLQVQNPRAALMAPPAKGVDNDSPAVASEDPGEALRRAMQLKQEGLTIQALSIMGSVLEAITTFMPLSTFCAGSMPRRH